jgi:hypothetical protein
MAMGRNTCWQFSLLGLLALMSIAAILLTLFRREPVLALAIAAVTAGLLIGDTFVRFAKKRHWAAATNIAWMLVAAMLAAMVMIALLVAYG